ncbi:hypothetical protein MPH_07103, partial [Macrophomina phaseolina MS6]
MMGVSTKAADACDKTSRVEARAPTSLARLTRLSDCVDGIATRDNPNSAVHVFTFYKMPGRTRPMEKFASAAAKCSVE